MSIVDARFAVADADFRHQAACTVGRTQFVALVFDVACIDDFAYACNRVASSIMALLRTCDGIFNFLPEVATVGGKATVVVVEANFGIAGTFGFGAVCNRRNGVSASMLTQCIVRRGLRDA